MPESSKLEKKEKSKVRNLRARIFDKIMFWDFWWDFLCDSVFVVCEGGLWAFTAYQAHLWWTHNLYLCLV